MKRMISNSNLKIGDQMQQGMSWPMAGQQNMWQKRDVH